MKRLLAIFPRLPGDPSKNAQLLILRRLTEHGWHPTVLTLGEPSPQHSDTRWQDVDFHYLQPQRFMWKLAYRLFGHRRNEALSLTHRVASRCLMPLSLALCFPDLYVRAKRELVATALRLHQSQPFDLTLSLYNPLSAHLAAQEFHSISQVPWVAMTKDYYSWPPHFLNSRIARVANRIKQYYEPRSIRGARMLVSISDYMNQHLQKLLPATDIRTLPHCYDEESFADKAHRPIDDCFRLVSMGIVRTRDGFGDHEKLRTLMMAVAELRQEGVNVSQLRLRFVGQKLELVQALAARYGCDDLLELPGSVTHDEAMQELVQATCLFYIQTEFGTRRRLTECIGARRPILAYPDYPGTFSNQLLDDYGAARIANDKRGLKKHLRELLEQFTSKKTLELPINDVSVAKHSAGKRAAEFATLLEQVVTTPARA